MEKEEIPLLSDIIKNYEEGNLQEFKGVIQATLDKEHNCKLWIPYQEIKAMSEAHKNWIEVVEKFFYGKYGK